MKMGLMKTLTCDPKAETYIGNFVVYYGDTNTYQIYLLLAEGVCGGAVV
jgi:hypothetical protein